MKKQFYEKVLPSQGVYCATGIRTDGRAYNRFTNSVDELLEIADEIERKGHNVFIALHSFGGYSRLADDAVFAKSFYIDLDVEPGKPGKYDSKEDAIAALDRFVKDQKLPPPVVVNSGSGVHAYWIFDVDVPSRVWAIYAEKFKRFCTLSLIIDASVTADRSRVLRVPESTNRKTDPPKPTSFITSDFTEWSFDAFRELLGEADEGLTDIEKILASVEKGLDEDTARVADVDPGIETVFEQIALRSLRNEGGCRQIDYMLRNAATITEPYWRAGLSVARACADWEEAIHIMSSEHPGYTPEATVAKAQTTVDSNGRVLVQKCSTIESLGPPGGCDGCPYKGKITNPLVLGRRVREPITEEVENEDSLKQSDPDFVPRYIAYPTELKPFSRGQGGGVWFTPPPKKSADGTWELQPPMRLCQHDVYPIKRMYNDTDGESLLMRNVLPHDTVRDFVLPMASCYSQDKFKDIMVRHGVLFEVKNTPYMMDYVIKWGTYLVTQKAAELTRMQMGWTDDNNGFVVGDREYRRDGTIVKTAASPNVRQVAKLLRTEGSYTRWRESAQRLNDPGYEVHAFAFLSGFGSPLLRLTPVKGVLMGLIGDSGIGKSGALIGAASLFGEPNALVLSGAKQGATDNAMLQWYMALKSMMLGLDEASNYEGKTVSNFFYKLTEGKNKQRMQSSNNSVREIESQAALITVLTANHSMVEKVTQFKQNPEGELARYLEFTITRPPTLSAEEGNYIFGGFSENYGWAGPEYIQQVMRTGDEFIRERFQKWSTRFYRTVGNNSAYRFFEALICANFVGAELAAEAGIVNFDLDRIYRTILVQIINNTEGTTIRRDYTEILGEFQNKHIGSTLVIDNGRVIREPKTSSLVARINLDEGLYYVSKLEIKKHLATLQVGYNEFAAQMKNKGLLLDDEKKQRLATGWAGMSVGTSAISVLVFKDVIDEELFKSDGN